MALTFGCWVFGGETIEQRESWGFQEALLDAWLVGARGRKLAG